ncbi:MAG: 4Fe-4S binding protein [Pirellulaceae bacterium]|jgi:polyferredoxin|nr:4Fe-4S binding protein [Pirellulaceae bacterium]
MAPMTKHNSMPFTARLARWRGWIQAGFLLLWLDPLALRLHTVCSPVFHCYSCPLAFLACPIGVLANFSALHLVPFVALGTLLAIGAVLGSFVCGWACPFGYVQDLVARVPTRKFELPGWLGYGRYVVLAVLVLAIPYFFGEAHPLFFCRVCPAGALEAALPHTASTALTGPGIAWPSAAKMSAFGVVTAAMFFTWRPWCTVLCPLGAVYALCNHVSLFFLKFHPQRCNDCDLCRRLCHYHARSQRRGDDQRCIRCLDCTRCSAVTISHVFDSTRVDPAEAASEREDVVTIRPANHP